MNGCDIKARLLLVDDHAIVRAGFRYLLETDADYEIKEVSSAEEACNLYEKYKPDVVIMDLIMPGMGGLEGVRHIRAKDEKARVLITSMKDDRIYVDRAKKAGAMGYVTKRSALVELAKAVSHIIKGREYLSADVAVVHAKHERQTDEEKIKCLSEREFDVFCLLADGRRVIEISDDLHLSPKTVSNHRTHIMQKLNASSIVELTRLAIRFGLMEA